MRISELSERTGVPVATIKYYLREGLLPAGTATALTQAVYGEEHVQRLRLVRVLREVGQVPVASIHGVLAAVDDPSLELTEVLALAHRALGPAAPPPSPEQVEARAAVAGFVDGLGWRVDGESPALDALAAALVALQRVIGPCGPEIFAGYATAAEGLARDELATIDASQGVADAVGQVVVGTVVFEQAFVALRRLAEHHFCSERFGPLPEARRPRSGSGRGAERRGHRPARR